jgi:hypothetical protein
MSTPSATPSPAAAVTQAWQGALAAEQRAVFGYGLVGAHLRAYAELVRRCAREHQDGAGRCRLALRARGAEPVPPAADYPQLYPVADAAQALALAARLEQECASAWRYLYATAARARPAAQRGPADRAAAQAQLNASAVRATRWRRIADPAHATVPFPGL